MELSINSGRVVLIRGCAALFAVKLCFTGERLKDFAATPPKKLTQ
jgi:hypothetical protein